MLRRLSAVLAAVALAGTLVLLTGGAAQAAGSGDLMPTDVKCQTGGACRVSVEWRNDTYGPSTAGDAPLRRRTLFSVYAAAGEQILTGSSSMDDAGTPDVAIWDPGVVPDPEAVSLATPSFSCSAQRTATGDMSRGVITDRSRELAGARSADGTANPGGYSPCVYTVRETGIHRVAFYGSSGGNSGTQSRPGTDIKSADGTFEYVVSTDLGTAVMAWDVTVRTGDPSSTTDLPGRVFTYSLAGYTGKNSVPVDVALHMTTPDGFRYVVDTNGFDPSGFLLYANGTGFLDPHGSPLHHDVVAGGASATIEKMSTLVGGTHLGRPMFPLSLEPLAAETLTALGIPLTPVGPTLENLSFTGRTAANQSYQGQGGSFRFTTATAGPYQVVISRDGVDFDPTLPGNRVLRGSAVAGANTVVWDGADNAGAAFPAGHAYAVRAFHWTVEYHVAMLDVESSVKGGPSIVLTNPPGGICPLSGVVSTGTNCSRAFYDDRGYTTSTNVPVGAPNGPVGGQPVVQPAPGVLVSDQFAGFDSTSTQRAFGTTTNVKETFGDTKGLDTWTYVASPLRTTTVDVVALPAAAEARDDAVETLAGQTLAVPGSALLGNDTGSGLRVTGTTPPAHGTATVEPDGALTYEPDAGTSGTDTFTYTVTDDADRSASATVTVTVRPNTRDDSAVTSMDTPVTVPAARGLLANDTGTDLTVAADHAAHGTLAVHSDGGFTYTPDPGFVGSEDITYEVTDRSGLTSTARLRLTVTAGGPVVDPTPPPVVVDPTPPVVDPTPPVADEPTPPVVEDLVSVQPPAEVLPAEEPVLPVAEPATDRALAVAPALPVPATAAAVVVPVEEPAFPVAPAYPAVPVLPAPAAPVAPAPARATPRATSAAPGEPPTTSAEGDGGPFTLTAASAAIGVLSVGTAAGLAVLGVTWLRRRRGL